MKLTEFAVVHERGDASQLLDDPLVHCRAGRQLVLTYVSRQGLMDYCRVPGVRQITLRQWNMVVDRNLDAFSRIIEAKFERDDWMIYSIRGRVLPRLVVTLQDMESSTEDFSIDVLDLDAGFGRRA